MHSSISADCAYCIRAKNPVFGQEGLLPAVSVMQHFVRQACFGAAFACGSRAVHLTQQFMFGVQDCAEEQLRHPH